MMPIRFEIISDLSINKNNCQTVLLLILQKIMLDINSELILVIKNREYS